ncbi:hypothetical protein MKZ38_003376 [Zalerion maritima]|uniref:Uncharacterized protein n=1 Tax=Zalerion maritima TaxID=339359 RepID=A0AAD5WQA7_9PEZI|nr:hypothetical protein MKZ38_003376 [Zalerion maritima]
MLPSCSVRRSTLVLSAMLLSATNTIPTAASAATTPSYFQPRDDADICGADDLSQCDLSGFPKNFCCNDDRYCLVGAANTTVICCPDGSACEAIAPIVCDLESQNVDLTPTSLVKTVLLEGTLPECGLGCCPWGYTCGTSSNDEPACIRDDDQDTFPEGASLPAASPTSTTSQSSSSTSEPTSSSSSSSTTTAAPLEGENDGTKDKHDNTGLIAGTVVGVVAVVAFTVAGIFLCVRNRRKRGSGTTGTGGGALGYHHHGAPERKRSSTSSFGNIISDPIMNPDTLRSDFGRAKEASTTSSRVTSAGSGMPASSRPVVIPGTQASINRYWGKEVAEAKANGKGAPHMEPGPKVGIARVGTAKGRTGAPQIGEIDMGLRATSSKGGSSNSRNQNANPFHDDMHRFDDEEDDSDVSPRSTTRQQSLVPPIRGMNHSRPYTPKAQQQRPSYSTTGQSKYNAQYRPREPSGADIDVFADPATLADSPGLDVSSPPGGAGRHSTQTTFSDMMERANLGDVARGAPYVPRSTQQTPTRPQRR